jgi:hypothetical protein
MRAYEFLLEKYYDTNIQLSNYRGPHDNPRTNKKYPSSFDDAGELWDIIDQSIEKGISPEPTEVQIDKLLATQDWLKDTRDNDVSPWTMFTDHPVVVSKNEKLYIVDGHHKVSRALKNGDKNIEVYIFK